MRGCTDPPTRSIVVTPAAQQLRHALSPTAWLVLEELLLGCEAGVAAVSVRQLGRSLGLAKDTAARAVRELRAAGLVAVSQRRTDAGAYDTGSYRISIPAGITIVDATPTRAHHDRASRPALARDRALRRPVHEQNVLQRTRE